MALRAAATLADKSPELINSCTAKQAHVRTIASRQASCLHAGTTLQQTDACGCILGRHLTVNT